MRSGLCQRLNKSLPSLPEVDEGREMRPQPPAGKEITEIALNSQIRRVSLVSRI